MLFKSRWLNSPAEFFPSSFQLYMSATYFDNLRDTEHTGGCNLMLFQFQECSFFVVHLAIQEALSNYPFPILKMKVHNTSFVVSFQDLRKRRWNLYVWLVVNLMKYNFQQYKGWVLKTDGSVHWWVFFIARIVRCF